MGWIGKDFLTRKCADFHMVAHYEKVGGISYERESNRTLRCVGTAVKAGILMR